jgi:hypothetical protein
MLVFNYVFGYTDQSPNDHSPNDQSPNEQISERPILEFPKMRPISECDQSPNDQSLNASNSRKCSSFFKCSFYQLVVLACTGYLVGNEKDSKVGGFSVFVVVL